MISYSRSCPFDNDWFSELYDCKNLNASVCNVSARSPRPVIFRFSRTNFSTLLFISMNVALAAPLLNASIPTLPTPAKRSRKRASSTRVERISKRAVFTRSIIGRVPGVLGPLSLRPLASPVTTRMRFLPVNKCQDGLHLFHEVIFLCPGNECFYLVNL